MKPGLWNRALRCVVIGSVQCLIATLLHSVPCASAEHLPFRHYGLSDGLCHSHVNAIHQDAKGYMWFGTSDGLSRFDGYRFMNYTTRDGLPHHSVSAITEDLRRNIWVGTNGGGAACLPGGPEGAPWVSQSQSLSLQQQFVHYQVGDSAESNKVNAMLFDSAGSLWCATNAGLYRALPSDNGGLRAFEFIKPGEGTNWNSPAFADSWGRLWFGLKHHLIEVVQGEVVEYGPEDGVGTYEIVSAVEDHEGRLLVANVVGVFEFVPPARGGQRGRWERFPLPLSHDQAIHSLVADRSGTLWVGTTQGLVEHKDGWQTLYGTNQGLSDHHIVTMTQDREGNLWIGTASGGVCKLQGETIVSFTQADGLLDQRVWRVTESLDGRIYASTDGGLFQIAGGRAVPIHKSLGNARVLQDARGDWWVGTDTGLFRFSGPELDFRRGQEFTARDGIISGVNTAYVVCVYEDSSHKLWAGLTDSNLYWFDPARKEGRRFQHIAISGIAFINCMTMDRSGTLWLAAPDRWGSPGRLGRLTNGRLTFLDPTEWSPDRTVYAFFQDSRGWLWIGTEDTGVFLTTDPAAEHPSFRHYSTESGLASDAVWSIAEDDHGRMYFATGRGLDRLSAPTGRIHHFSVADGLAGDQINYCVKDRLGRIWIGASGGVSRLDPRAERLADQPPPIYLSRVTVAGEDRPLPADLRQRELTLPASRNNLLIEYVGLSFQSHLKYQYRLEGVDSDWSSPGDARSVDYAHLAAGSYRFTVRAVNEEGLASLEPAVLEFRILAALWQRWWFLTIAAMLAGLIVYAAVRYRFARLIELERVRTRIATDLHDDIGSNLSLVAMLTEVIRQQVGREDPRVIERLKLVARVSVELVDSMSDIVWAVNPKKDSIQELTQRMRRFASDLLTAREITIRFRAEGVEQDVKIGADRRRQVFLVFKEALNNMVRHSGCTAADIELKIDGRGLVLKVSDNGRGFDQLQVTEGNGLASMRRRAQEQGGILRVTSESARGTTVTLVVPIGRRNLNTGVRRLSQKYFGFESRGLKARSQGSRFAGRRSGLLHSNEKTTR